MLQERSNEEEKSETGRMGGESVMEIELVHLLSFKKNKKTHVGLVLVCSLFRTAW